MDAVTVVKLCLISLELICAVILAGFMGRAIGIGPFRAMLTGLEILAFMVVACFPAPRVPGRHSTARMVTA